MKKLLLLSMTCLLTGCVHHLTQQECQTMNWYNEGVIDGSAGKNPRDLSQSEQDCLKFKININAGLYSQGWNAGVKQYCTPTKDEGITDGRNGAPTDKIKAIRGDFCTAAGSPLKLNTYLGGYNYGIQTYCTYQHGYEMGIGGLEPGDVCPSHLRGKFMAGWNAGGQKFCGNTNNAFALGRAGSPYPTICTPSTYVAFSSEYNRGLVISQRIGSLQSQVDSINQTISNNVWDYKLVTFDNQTYTLGNDKSQQAQDALAQVRLLVQQRDQLKTQIFNAQTKR